MSPPVPHVADFDTLHRWFEIAPDAMLAVDPDGVIVLANAQSERLFGYPSDTLTGQPLEILVPESLRHAHGGLRRDFMAKPRVRPMGMSQELTGLRRDGREFPIEIGLSPVDTERGTIVLASLRDISDTRRVRQAQARARRDQYVAQIGRLALESQDYETAVRGIPGLVAAALEVPAVAILSTEWHRSQLRVRAATGLSPQATETLASVLGDADFVRSSYGAGNRDPITSATTQDGVLAMVRSRLAEAGFHAFAMVPLFGRYEPLGVLAALAPGDAAFDQGKVEFLQAVSGWLAAAVQRNRTEEQLAHAQRLDAIGQLTGGIAHDFNNLLTVISGNLQLLEAELPERPDLREIIDSGVRAVSRGSDLTRRLLAFARRQPLQPRAVVPKPLLEELGHMLRRTLGESIAIDIECDADVPDVYADANELDTALVNLSLNARDAMPRGGRLAIAAREVMVESSRPGRKLPPGRYVAFTVSDTGTGMAPDVLAHALEPFFTTKGAAKGSGLGLSMVYGFATQSGGGMSIDSRLGYGTRVELSLPVASAPSIQRASAPVVPDAPAEGRKLVLVVEDEDDVRTIAARFLLAIGYEVITASGARDALEILTANPDVDLLFSDVALGSGMNGVELAQEARRLRPALAVLLTSGYERAAYTGRLHDPEIGFELLRKPYLREQLAEAVGRILGRP